MANDLIASMVLAIWLYLIAARGGFWRAAERDDEAPPRDAGARDRWPAVTAVIPARDEAECVGADRRLAVAAGLSGRLST